MNEQCDLHKKDKDKDGIQLLSTNGDHNETP